MLLQNNVLPEMESGNFRAPSDQFCLRQPEYLLMKPREFGQRLRQERRYCKYCNYLESKREASPYNAPSAEDGRIPIDKEDSNKFDQQPEGNKQHKSTNICASKSEKKRRIES